MALMLKESRGRSHKDVLPSSVAAIANDRPSGEFANVLTLERSGAGNVY